MTSLVHELISHTAGPSPEALALKDGDRQLNYGGLKNAVTQAADFYLAHGLGKSERVAVYLDKRLDTVVGPVRSRGSAGGVFVPVNPTAEAGTGGPHPAPTATCASWSPRPSA
jgi:non-ribosomal peptide synthetase component F